MSPTCNIFFIKKSDFGKKFFRARFCLRIGGVAGIIVCEKKFSLIIYMKKSPEIMKFKTDKFFVGVYILVALMVVLQVAIVVWGAFC